MPHSLIVVESPTKVKTIKKFLGEDFEVRATMGHVKDLPKSGLGIDIEKGFEPTYKTIETKKKALDEIKKAAKKAAAVYLAPDPDREGEAIAWHVAQEIGMEGREIHRVLFNDLTKNTVTEAIRHPRELDVNKYEAQQTRRILDRLVGYKISPLLWTKVKRGLSAGRVQSVAVRLICDREEEIKAFKPEEYWTITALLEAARPPAFEARLTKIHGRKAKVANEAQAQEVVDTAGATPFRVTAVERKETKRSPSPPFTTSKLQQEAARSLGFPAKKTMTIAQRLYEGVELGEEGPVGLITYMRTDSVRIAAEALEEARRYIRENYDAAYLPARAVTYRNSSTAQDAHEAIRPSSLAYTPQKVKKFLRPDEFKLYQLIWNRFLASQMTPARFDQTVIECAGGPYTFRAMGSIMKFDGYTVVYKEGKEENGTNGDEAFGKILPDCAVGEELRLLDLKKEQKFTQPPPRFSEATLVKELEEKGIGRPSTYAAILSTIQERQYVRLEKGRFVPTALGKLVTDLLVENFPRILDVAFTAAMESELDGIEEGKANRVETLNRFYGTFAEELEKAGTAMRDVKGVEIPTEIPCEKCGRDMVIKWGKNGEFLACSNYPECRNTMNFTRDEDGRIIPAPLAPQEGEHLCELCGRPMILREGRYGAFLGCSGYPECKNIVNVKREENGDLKPDAPPATDRVCEKCGRPMVRRKGRYGFFLGCSGYPECTNIVRLGRDGRAEEAAKEAETTDEVCERCGRPMAVRRGRYGPFLGCTGYPECKNIKKIPRGK